MDLRLHPLDKQVCVLQIASYGWAKDDLIYKWKEKDPVQVVPGLHLPRFTLEQYKSAYCDVITNTGEYSCLMVELIFKREFSYYLITIYVPCCMLVIVSWVSFWLDQNAIPARVSLGVTTLLTMSTQTSGINAQLPPVSYTKAIDVWTGACQCFVFCALLEFALVNYACRSDMQRDRARDRFERAKRQWELEHASESLIDPALGGDNSQGGKQIGDSSGTSGSACNTLSSNKGNNNGGSGAATMNHINSAKALKISASADSFTLKKRTNKSNQEFNDLEAFSSSTQYISTTPYPHPRPSSPEQSFTFPSDSFSNPYPWSSSRPLSSHQLTNIDPTQYPGAAALFELQKTGGDQLPRQCEVHMNGFQPPFGMTAACGNGPTTAHHQQLNNASSHQRFQQARASFPQAFLHVLFYCCRANGLLAKFPSRAKRIDVISRFIFPLIFAIFNLSYWLYYLLAQNNVTTKNKF